MQSSLLWLDRKRETTFVGCVCACVYLFALAERVGMEGCGLWVKGGRGDSQLRGLQPQKHNINKTTLSPG